MFSWFATSKKLGYCKPALTTVIKDTRKSVLKYSLVTSATPQIKKMQRSENKYHDCCFSKYQQYRYL